jgi:hypothetical protein
MLRRPYGGRRISNDSLLEADKKQRQLDLQNYQQQNGVNLKQKAPAGWCYRCSQP